MVNMIELSEEMKKELAFTEEEIKELENARKMPITFDEDCPETTPERAVRFRRVNLNNAYEECARDRPEDRTTTCRKRQGAKA